MGASHSSQNHLLLERRHKARLVESKGSLATSLDVHFGQLPEHKVAGQQQSFTRIGVALGHLQDQQRLVGQQGRALVQSLAPASSAHDYEAALGPHVLFPLTCSVTAWADSQCVHCRCSPCLGGQVVMQNSGTLRREDGKNSMQPRVRGWPTLARASLAMTSLSSALALPPNLGCRAWCTSNATSA